MKTKFLSFAIAYFFWIVGGNAQVSEMFSDGDFTNNPTWVGDTAKFDIDGSFMLQLNDTSGTDPAYLSTPSQSINDATWEFDVNMTFATSSSNYSRFYIVSDNADLTGSLNGYYVRVGGATGSVDEISLYRQDGSSSVEIIDGRDGVAGTATVAARIKVTRDAVGNWTLSSDTAMSGSFILEGDTLDNTYTVSEHIGMSCIYTSTRSDKFFFDSIVVTGTFLVDTIGPQVISITSVASNQIDLSFDENVDTITAKVLTNYLVNSSFGNPTSAVVDAVDPKLVHLTFANNFSQSVEYQIQVSGVEDNKGNVGANQQLPFTFFIPSYKDVVINEIFADYSPVIGLPEAEFVELFNRTDQAIDITGWRFTDGSSDTVALGSYILQAGAYVILTDEDNAAVYSIYGSTMGIANFPALNNSGDDLRLEKADREVIDEVLYSSSWYNDAVKDDGGYTLELIDAFAPCGGATNWTGSVAQDGGTPGRENSVRADNSDTDPPRVLRAVAATSDQILVYFDETVNTATFDEAQVTIDGGLSIGTATFWSDNMTLSIRTIGLLEPKTVYTITVGDSIRDCNGNLITTDRSASVVLPEEIAVGDLLINEVLFNPFTGGSDFVEVYNISNKYLDMQDLYFLIVQDTGGYTWERTAEDYWILGPGEYVVFSEDIADVANDYPLGKTDRYLEIDDLPSYNDSDGEVLIGILDSAFNATLLDSMGYDKDMHFELIDDDDGVSLERIDFNVSASETGNWHSAAKSVGYATPGYLNSQSATIPSASQNIEITPELFTPDDDGFNDFVTISYNFDQPGYVANITIFDSYGRPVKELANNDLLSPQGFYQWDGINQDGRKVLVGNYIVLFEIFDVDGNRERFKKLVAVGAQF